MVVGGYWVFFSHQKWFDRSWVERTINTAAQGNYLPVYSQILKQLVVPNSSTLALLTTILEAAVGFMLILGILTRIAAIVGSLIDINLTMIFGFCNCTADFPLVFWFYFAPFLLNVQLIFDRSSEAFGIQTLVKRAIAGHRIGD